MNHALSKIHKTKKFLKTWGSNGEAQLGRVFDEAYLAGFTEAGHTSDTYSFFVYKTIDADLTACLSISRCGEYPKNVFSFDTSLMVFSHWLQHAENAIFPPYPDHTPHPRGSTVFVMPLSHYRWNEGYAVENPCWHITDIPGYEDSIDRWMVDWRRLMLPVAQSIHDLPSLLEQCQKTLAYKPNFWVKSDAYLGLLDINTALLLLKNNQKQQALELLTDILATATRAGKASQVRLAFEWAVKY